MQKTKFKIKGLRCDSCALLIEEKLKNNPGIIKIKVDKESCKGVAVYDEQKINENKIFQVIEEIEDFKVEKIEELQKTHEDNNERKILKEIQSPSKIQSFSKALIVINVVFLIMNFVLLNSALGSKNNTTKQNNINNQNEKINPSQVQQKDKQVKQEGLQTFSITNADHIRGNFNSPITMVEFSDFECPFCEKYYPTLNKILSDYKGKVRLVYKHFPLGFHKNAQKAAEASECASEQGKFWEYHDKIFENQSNGLSLEKFKQWAKDLGLNSGKFNNCLDSGKFTQKVKGDQQEGSEKGVNGTPATFVNGQLVSGAVPYNSLKQTIDKLLALNNSAQNQPIANEIREFKIDASKFNFNPDNITVKRGQKIKLTIDNTDTIHGIRIPGLNVSGDNTIEFTADKAGEFAWYCNNYCGDGHSEMKGKIIVN